MWILNQKSDDFKARFKRKYGFDLDNLGFWWPFLDDKLEMLDGQKAPTYERFDEWLLRHSPFETIKEMWDYIHYVWKHGFNIMNVGTTQLERFEKWVEKYREWLGK